MDGWVCGKFTSAPCMVTNLIAESDSKIVYFATDGFIAVEICLLLDTVFSLWRDGGLDS